jgi:hypothetical protein
MQQWIGQWGISARVQISQYEKKQSPNCEKAVFSIKACVTKEGVRIGKTPKKLASICCP